MPRPFFCLVALIVTVWGEAGLARVIGTVQDASALHVRSGPGTQHSILVTLGRGTKVDVEEVGDDWILVETPGGQRGYVHKRFLRLEGEAPEQVEPPVRVEPAQGEPAVRAPQPGAEVRGAAGSPVAVSEPAKTVVAAGMTPSRKAEEASSPTGEPPAITPVNDSAPARSTVTDAPAFPPPDEWRGLRADVDRLIALTEEVSSEVAEKPPAFTPAAPEVDYGEPPGAGPILAVAGAGALVGFFLGTLYGRRQERGRRSRVRL